MNVSLSRASSFCSISPFHILLVGVSTAFRPILSPAIRSISRNASNCGFDKPHMTIISSRTGAGYHDHDWELGKDYPAGFVQFTTQRNCRELIALIAEKRLLVDQLTTHRIPLENIREAGDLLVEHPDQALGVILTMKH